MKIILEGIDGSGKTTILHALTQVLKGRECKHRIIDEIEDSPISDILFKMLKEDPFFRINNKGNLLPYATLLLLADHQYKQNTNYQDIGTINIFDRDYPTLIVYQQRLLKDFYGDNNIVPLLNAIEEFARFDITPTDLIVYVDTPLSMCIERVKERSRRENEQFREDEILFLNNVKDDFENVFLPLEKERGTNILYVDGTKNPTENANIIADKIILLKNIMEDKGMSL